MDGGAGTDTASYATATAAVVANLASPTSNSGDAYLDSYIGIENLTGSNYADTLTGNGSDNSLAGGGGADNLYGNGGNDTLTGGAGADYLKGGSGTDMAVLAGKSTDYSWVKNADGSWTITDLRSGSPDGKDTLVSIELLQFNDGQKTLGTSSTSTVAAAAEPHLDLMPSPSHIEQHAGWPAVHETWLASLDKDFLLA